MSALGHKRTCAVRTPMSALGQQRTWAQRPVRKENGGRPTTYSVQRAPPFRANVARFLRRPVERQDRLLFALVRRPLPPYGGTRVSETKSLLKGPTSEEQNRNMSFYIAICFNLRLMLSRVCDIVVL